MKINKPITSNQLIEYFLKNDLFLFLDSINNYGDIDTYLELCDETWDEAIKSRNIDEDKLKQYLKLEEGKDYLFVNLRSDKELIKIKQPIQNYSNHYFYDDGEYDLVLFCYN